MRALLIAALCFPLLGSPTPVSACEDCDRDGSRHYLMAGEFVRYQQTRFMLHVRVQEGGREWIDRVPVVPMALPEKDGEAVSWSSLHEGDFIEVNVRETQEDRVVTRVVVVRSAPSEDGAA